MVRSDATEVPEVPPICTIDRHCQSPCECARVKQTDVGTNIGLYATRLAAVWGVEHCGLRVTGCLVCALHVRLRVQCSITACVPTSPVSMHGHTAVGPAVPIWRRAANNCTGGR